MKRLTGILLIMTALSLSVQGREKLNSLPSRMTFGLEWGYMATIQSAYHYNFFSSEGYRINDLGNEFGFMSNAEVYIHLGCNLNSFWNLSLYMGIEGIADIHKAVPVSLRMTRYFNENAKGDRWLSFVDIGSGISVKKPVQEILTGKIGGGYRISLSRFTKLDFIMAARFILTHPQIHHYDEEVPMQRINRNNAYITMLSAGISLTF